MRFKKIIASALSAPMLIVGSAVFMTAATPMTASAQSSAKAVIDQAKSTGTVGETASGYLALINRSADSAVVNAMNEINIGRKTVYTKIARAQGVSVEVVAALTGEKQLAKAKPGSKVMTAEGRWVTVN